MWKEIRQLFPIHKQCTYLNNAGISPPSVRVQKALETYHRKHTLYGWRKVASDYFRTGDKIKAILARWMECEASCIALLHNTSEGMNVVAQGYPWRPGDGVLILDREYPANVYPWLNLEDAGVKVLRLNPSHTSLDLDLIEKHLDRNVRVASVSAVDWCTGYAIDTIQLGEICRRKGVHLVLDVAQALGTVSVHPVECGAAAMAGSAWKGLMGPVGTGICYVSPQMLETLSLVFVGTSTVVDDENYLDYRLVPKPDASRFEFSTPNYNDWVYLLASLELLDEIGLDQVRSRLLFLNTILREALEQKGYTVLGSTESGEQSSLLAFHRHDLDAKAKTRELAQQDIIVIERDDAIRVSPHIYNNEADLHRLLRCL